jgi:sugar/nucleoside kinase (ribokinase family)
VLLANDAEADVLRDGRPFSALERHAKLAVVKQGPDGASGYAGSAAWHAAASPVTVVDTTGAGDAFDAAFMVEWLASGNVEAALQAGNRLGAHVAAHLGAQPASPAQPPQPRQR